jgi:hypothetical protein
LKTFGLYDDDVVSKEIIWDNLSRNPHLYLLESVEVNWPEEFNVRGIVGIGGCLAQRRLVYRLEV